MYVLAKAETLPVVGVLIVALIARLPGLDSVLWYDEIWMLVTSVRLPLDELVRSYPASTHHALYVVLANLSVATFGEGPLALRLPALVFGLLAIGSTMLFVRLVGSKREAILVGFLFALSYHAVWFSQNARGYTGLLFFMTAAGVLFYLGWQGKRWAWPGYTIVGALGSYLHLFMTTVFVAHATILLAEALASRRLWARPAAGAARSAWLALAAGSALTVVLYAPAMPELIAYYTEIGPGGDPLADPVAPLRALIATLATNRAAALGALVLAVPVIVGLIAYGRHDRLALALLILPNILGSLVAVLVLRGVAPQFFICWLPVGFMLVARCVELSSGRWRGWLVGGVLTLSIASLLLVYRYPKQDFTGALAYVRQHSAPDATIAGFGLAGTAYARYYAPGIACIYTQDEYDRLLRHGRETWVLMTATRDARARLGEIYDHLLADFELVATFSGTLDDGHLYVYYRPA